MDAVTEKRSTTRMAASSARVTCDLRSVFTRCGERKFIGFVMDDDDPCRKFTVEILVDGYPARVVRADAPVDELVAARHGDGCYGFTCSLDDDVVNDSAIIEARLANSGTAVGVPIVLARPAKQATRSSAYGSVQWLGGLRFSGWINAPHEQEIGNVLVDGVPVARARATHWSHVGTSEQTALAVRGFDLHLHERFADGLVHRLAIVDDADESICGDPVVFIAFADGFRQMFAGHGSRQDQLRAKLLDQLLPMSVPFSQYQQWREGLPVETGASALPRGAVIIVGSEGAGDTLESLREQTHTKWEATSLPRTSGPTGLSPQLAEEFLRSHGAKSEFVVFTIAGTLLVPTAMARIAAAFVQYPDAQAVYGDLDIQSGDGSVWPLAFPAFDYERMLEQGYCAHLFALRRSAAKRALGDGASNLYRLFNSVLDAGAARNADVVHIPGALGTLCGIRCHLGAGRTGGGGARSFAAQSPGARHRRPRRPVSGGADHSKARTTADHDHRTDPQPAALAARMH